ncbi:MAG: VCBS repeat-containing protein [Bacteroidetes bacterium]|nr:VCBS repeat-containing protein [Bacteroidota bacterium]
MRRILTFLILSISFNFSGFGQITWTKKTGPYGGAVKDVVVNPNTSVAFALSGDNNRGIIYKSTDNGVSWVEVTPNLFGNDIGRINDFQMSSNGTLLAVSNNNLFKTTDDGVTWTKMNTGTSSSNNGFDQGYEVAVNPINGTIYVSGYDYSQSKRVLFRSINGGSTFTKGASDTNNWFSKMSMVNNSTTNGIVFCVLGGQLYQSTNDGVNFNIVNPNADFSLVQSIASKSDNSQLALVTGNSTIYTLSTPFTTWSGPIAETNITNGTTYGSSAVLAYSTDNASLYLMDVQNHKFYKGTLLGVWTLVSSAFTVNYEYVAAFAAKDANTLYYGSDVSMFNSTNAGTNWNEASSGIEGIQFNNMVIADNGNIILAGGKPNISTNSGSSWSAISGISSPNTIAFKATTGSPKPIVLLGTGGGTCYRSTDNGVTWSSAGLAASPLNAYQFVSYDGTKILGYGSNQFFFSSNQGNTWSAAITISGTGWPTNFNIYNGNIVVDQNIIYAYVYDYTSSTYKFFKIVLNSSTSPTTGAATLLSLPPGITDVNAIGYLNGKVFLSGRPNSGNSSLNISSDGVTWTSNTSISGFHIDNDIPNDYLFVTERNGSGGPFTINLTRDEGVTSVQSTISGLNPNTTFIYGIAIDQNGIAYAGITGTSIWATTGTVITPLAPSSFQSSGAGTDRITLRWTDNASTETNFIIEKYNGVSFDSIGYTSSSSGTGKKVYYEVQNLQPNTSYQFRVYATNAGGNSAAVTATISTVASIATTLPDNHSWSGTVAYSNPTVQTPIALTNVGIKLLANGFFSITDIANGAIPSNTVVPGIFQESNGSTYLSPANAFEPNLNGTWNGTTLVLRWISAPNLSPETTGTVTLTKNGTDPAPGSPSSNGAYVYSTTGIEVSWVGSSFETSYTVERSTSNTFASIDRSLPPVLYPSTSVVDNVGLVLGTTYYYRVKAVNGTGTSAPSNTATVVFTKPFFTPAGTVVETNPVYSSSGTVWGDFNGDGFDDLIIPQLTIFKGYIPYVPTIYKNNGAGDFIATVPGGISSASYTNAAVADYDNDGKLDLFLTGYTQNYLYKGNGDFTFTLIDPSPVSETGFGDFDLGISWSDYNKDGLVDLLVVPNTDSPLKNVRFFTQGPVNTFTKQTTGTLPSVAVSGSTAIWADYDNDGDQDVFINNNDNTPGTVNLLLTNNGDGTFTNVNAAPFTTDTDQSTFSASWADYNNDGFLDLFIGVSKTTTGNLLYKNNGNGTFSKQSMNTSVTEPLLSNDQTFSTSWGDINNDGYLDLMINVVGGSGSRIYINNNGTSFTKYLNEKFNDTKAASLGLALADYNHDGFLDLAVSALDVADFSGSSRKNIGPTVKDIVFKNNNAGNGNNWLELRLTGTTSNRIGIGTRVTLTAGGKTQIREVQSTTSFGSQPSAMVHFGLGVNTTVTSLAVKWPSGIIQNLSNVNSNQILNITEDNTGPVVTALSPTNGASNVNANTTIAITLDETSTSTASKFIKLYETSDLVNAVASIDVSSVTPSGKTFTYTLPQTLLPSTSYSVTVDAGAFKDVYGNPSLAIDPASWQFTSAVGPAVSLLNPLNSASNVAVSTKIEITFDKAITAVVGKKITVTIQGSGSPEFSLNVTAGTIVGNKVSFTPPASLGFLNIYDVQVDAGAFIDVNGNATTAITWSFVTLDNVAPTITFTPPQLDRNFSSTQFAVTAADNSGTVSSATLSYRKIAGGVFTDLAGTFDAVNSKWNFTVQESFFDANGLEFYLTAKDPANNVGRLPLDPNTNFYSYLNYKTTDNVIPSSQLGFGGTVSGWKIFTIPFDLGTSSAVSTVFDELSSLTIKVDWRMLTYKNNTAWAEYPVDFSSFSRGQGYFINIKNPVTLKMPDAPVSTNNRKNLFQMSLKKGWNQIGNPYLTAISWDDVKNFSGNTGLTGTGAVLKTLASGNYVNATTLQPFEGGFVLAENDVTISIPFAGQTTPGGRQENATFGKEDWILPMVLKSGETENTFGGIGMHSNASASFDQFDDVNAPRFMNYLEMNFAHPNHFAKDFARDVVPQSNEYTWEFTVDSNVKGLTDLRWENISNVIKDIYLYDFKNETIVNMKERNSYTFDSKSSSVFRIYYGDNIESKIKPQAITLGDAYPNPSNNSKVTIPFTLPDSQSSYQVLLEVCNSMGQKVLTLTNGLFNSGFYSYQWEPNEELISGLYIYRMKVVGKDNSSILSKKIIVNR